MVHLLLARQAGGEGEGVGRRHQMHGLSMSVGDLVCIDRGLASEVENRLDLEAAGRPEPFTDPQVGDRTVALHAGDAFVVDAGVGVDVVVHHRRAVGDRVGAGVRARGDKHEQGVDGALVVIEFGVVVGDRGAERVDARADLVDDRERRTDQERAHPVLLLAQPFRERRLPRPLLLRPGRRRGRLRDLGLDQRLEPGPRDAAVRRLGHRGIHVGRLVLAQVAGPGTDEPRVGDAPSPGPAVEPRPGRGGRGR